MLTLPVDAAKVRLQLQATTGAAAGAQPVYTGLMQGMHRIGMDEGAAALWRGYQPALVRQVSCERHPNFPPLWHRALMLLAPHSPQPHSRRRAADFRTRPSQTRA